MSERLDVRRMLLRRGWTEDSDIVCLLRKSGCVWAAIGAGDSSVSGPSSRGGLWTVGFDNTVPARVIVATCEAAAGEAA
jgi:hypothetical protein